MRRSRKGHHAVNDEMRCPLALLGRRWCHVHHSVWPLLAVVVRQVPHMVVIVLIVASVVDVGEGLRLQFHKDTEYRIGVVDGLQTLGIGWGKRSLVDDTQGFAHVCGRYIIRSAKRSAVFGLYGGCRSVVYGDANHLCIGHHLSARVLDNLCQGRGQLLRTTRKTVGSVDIKHADEGVHVGWRMTSNASIHGVHVGQHVAESFIVDVVCDKLVGRP